MIKLTFASYALNCFAFILILEISLQGPNFFRTVNLFYIIKAKT